MSAYPGSRSRRSNRHRGRPPQGVAVARVHRPSGFQQPLLQESPRGHIELDSNFPPRDPLSALSTYQPPDPTGSLRAEDYLMNPSFQTLQYGSIPTNTAMHAHAHPTYSILARHPNINPAVDRAIPLLAHGLCCCQCVRSQEVGFVEQCGEFQGILQPGLHCLWWPINGIAGRLSLRIQQLDVTCETVTKDHVFCHVTVSVQYRVSVTRSYEAFYSLSDPRSIMKNCVLDVIRSTIPTMTLDSIFLSTDDVAASVFASLQRIMLDYGYDMTEALVTRVRPNDLVRQSMDEIMASRYIKAAAPHKAEANKSTVVKKAEAHAERLHLEGVGVARGRRAIVKGMEESMALLADVDVRIVHPPSSKDIMNLLLVTQYLDLLAHLNPKKVVLKHGPGEVADLREGLANNDLEENG